MLTRVVKLLSSSSSTSPSVQKKETVTEPLKHLPYGVLLGAKAE